MKGLTLVTVVIVLLPAMLSAQWLPDQRLTNDPASSKTAENSNTWAVAARGDTTHVAWTDKRDGNDEVYYRRNPTGNVTVVELGPRDQCGSFRVAPNPLVTGFAVLRVQGFKNSRVQGANVRVFDADGCTATQELVVQRKNSRKKRERCAMRVSE